MGVKRRTLTELGLVPPGTDKPTTGNVFYVKNSIGADGLSSAGHGKTPEHPFKTLDFAVGQCTADQGDTIIIMEGSDETITSTIAVDVAGISIIALGAGQSRGMLTQGTSGSDNVMEISADDVYLENIFFKGSTTGTSETFINVQGKDHITIKNCVFEQNTKNLVAIEVDTLTDYLTIDGCTFTGVGAGPDSAIKFHMLTTGAGLATIKNPTIKNCVFNYTESAGCDNGIILVSMSSGGVAGILIQDCQFIGLADGDSAINPCGVTNGVATGLVNRIAVLTADVTDALVVSNLLGYIDVYLTAAGKRPAATLGGSGMSPLATQAL